MSEAVAERAVQPDSAAVGLLVPAGRVLAGPGPSSAELDVVLSWLGAESPAVDDAERIDRIAVLERVKAAAAAAQAVETARFDQSQRAAQDSVGVSERVRGRGVAEQVALARRESPVWGQRHVGLAQALTSDLPHTLAALRAGSIGEGQSLIVARETGWLSREDRMETDRLLGSDLGGLSNRALADVVRGHACRLDPEGAVAHRRYAEGQRRVSLRPAPDTMSWLQALLPVGDGVSVWAALTHAADEAIADGDERSRGQLMADTLVGRVTGRDTAGERPRVEVQLVMTDTTLVGADEEPAEVAGFGPIPASAARELVSSSDPQGCWLRRLRADGMGRLTARESTRRLMPPGLAGFIATRDRYCRTPWCGAGIRHSDHVVRSSDGGPTSDRNGQGLCARCNYAKEAPGWTARSGPGGAGDWVAVTTPTGHTYRSEPPPLPGCSRGREREAPPAGGRAGEGRPEGDAREGTDGPAP